MNENFLLKTEGARHLYFDVAAHAPIIDFHNHLSAADLRADRKYGDITELWLAPDPYKHRLMRICGVEERYITGDASPFEKFQKFCGVFPLLAGNPVYDWSRMELWSVFGIQEAISGENARRLYDRLNEMLSSPEFSTRGILSRFPIEYQSPVATLLEDLSDFGKAAAPSLRADDLLAPTEEFCRVLSQKSGVSVSDDRSYLRAVSVLLDRFSQKGCVFADHSLDAGFFDGEEGKKKAEMLLRLGAEYAKRGWTLLLHLDAKRHTSPRLRALAGAAGGFAAAGEGFPLSALADLLGRMEGQGGLPDTVLFPLNMSDQAPMAILQGSFSEDGVSSKVQLGPAWWWCDHAMGIRNTLDAIASFGAVSQFIGMTTDSRSILSFVRHDYFRRILCAWLDEKNAAGEWDLPMAAREEFVRRICYQNAKTKIERGNRE